MSTFSETCSLWLMNTISNIPTSTALYMPITKVDLAIYGFRNNSSSNILITSYQKNAVHLHIFGHSFDRIYLYITTILTTIISCFIPRIRINPLITGLTIAICIFTEMIIRSSFSYSASTATCFIKKNH